MTIEQLLRGAVGMAQAGRPRHSQPAAQAPEVMLRRAVIGVSLVGIAVVAATTLYQTRQSNRLIHPRQRDASFYRIETPDKVLRHGTPTSPLSIVSHAINIALAATGGKKRARKSPWLAVSATLATIPAALTAAQYLFYQMPVRQKRWCPHRIIDAVTHIATFGFTVFESTKALDYARRKPRQQGVVSRLLH